MEAVVRAPEEKKRLARPETHDFLCLSDLHDLRMGAAAIRRDPAGMARACRDHEMIGHRDFTDPARACALLAEHAGAPARACALLEPLFSGPERSKFCFKELLYFQGDPGVCAQLRAEPAAREICLGFDGLRASACGDSPICKALSGGGPEVCAPYLRRVRRGLCGRTQLDAEAWKDAEAALADAERLLALTRKKGSASTCRAAGARSLLNDFKGRRLPEAPGRALLAAVRPDLERLYLCRTLTEGGPEACRDLEALRLEIEREPGVPRVSFDLLCRTEYYEAKIALAMQRRENTVAELCVVRNVIGDRDFKLDSINRSCGIVAGYSGSTTATCGALGPYFDNDSIARTCPKMLRFVTGDPSVCPLFEDPLVRERCDGYVALRRLLDSGGRVDCGGSDYCRTLTGAGAPVCRALETQVLDRYCAGSTPEALAPGVDEALKGAQASLSLPPSRDLGQAPAALRARRLKLERLKAELARLWPGRFSAPPAGGDKTPRDP